MAGWDTLKDIIRLEIVQRREEGCRVDGILERWEQAGDDETKLMACYERLSALRPAAEFPYEEPNGLDEIRALAAPGSDIGVERLMAQSGDVWNDRFLGAWLVRSVGCMLGKPVEHPPYLEGEGGRAGWENVKLWFEEASSWPIRDYVPKHSRAEQLYGLTISHWGEPCLKGQVSHVISDDDIRYTVLGLILLDDKGIEWDTWDVGKYWHWKLTYGQVCTAETQAYRNFAQVASHMESERPPGWESKLADVALHLNPYREWIGAQIRVDAYAYAAAGRPRLAAELAWRDARFSHVKNGIYGAMFVAGLHCGGFCRAGCRAHRVSGTGSNPAHVTAVGSRDGCG